MMNCTKCSLPVTYQPTPEHPERVFLLADSLSDKPKVSFGDDDVPDCIQPTVNGEVRASFTITSKADRCRIKRVEGNSVEIEVKDVDTDERTNQLFMQYLVHVLGCSRENVELDFGAHSRNKVYLIKQKTPVDVYHKLKEAAKVMPSKFYKATADHCIKGEI
eukprot:TRINITY_DN4605_c0_g1_i4.p1 TRINITY_DN4605_c0_g1~~TRINITY_DN4605_c0_g1_i4.p1  ORF type:complete len:162 (-),score=43.44 TRINITY_DN4605_c0_g1_i4:413-898(-)